MGQVLTQEQINELIIKLEKEKADNPLGDIDNTVKRKNFIAFVKALYVCKYCREMRRFEYEKGSSIYKRTRTTNLNDIFRKQCDPKMIRNVCISSAFCNHNFILFAEILRSSLTRHYYSMEQSKIQELEALIKEITEYIPDVVYGPSIMGDPKEKLEQEIIDSLFAQIVQEQHEGQSPYS